SASSDADRRDPTPRSAPRRGQLPQRCGVVFRAMRLRQRLRYRFDNMMARGVGAQILLLAALTATFISIAGALLFIFGLVPADDQGNQDSVGKIVWRTLNHTLDPGNLGGVTAGWGFLFVMLFATLGGIFIVSALFGIINQNFGETLERLRRGKSAVAEKNHV